jgi:hypothetical protein
MAGSLPPSPRRSWASSSTALLDPGFSHGGGSNGGYGGEQQDPAPASWARRAQNRLEELRRFFGLPDDETLIDEYHCALRKTILFQVGAGSAGPRERASVRPPLGMRGHVQHRSSPTPAPRAQGRMYVFDSHICFYSNVFGFIKKKVISYKVRGSGGTCCWAAGAGPCPRGQQGPAQRRAPVPSRRALASRPGRRRPAACASSTFANPRPHRMCSPCARSPTWASPTRSR